MKKSNRILFIGVGVLCVGVVAYALTARMSTQQSAVWSAKNAPVSSVYLGAINQQATNMVAKGAFDRLDVGGYFNVTIQGSVSEPSVKIHAPANVQPYIKTKFEGGILKLHLKHGTNLGEGNRVNAAIQVKTLQGANFGGNNTFTIKGIQAQHFKLRAGGKNQGSFSGEVKQLYVDAGGKSSLTVNDSNAQDVYVKVAGDNQLQLSGKTNKLIISAAGKATINAKNLIANEVVINGAGQSEITVHANKRLIVRGVGQSEVAYYGNPADVSKSGFGQIELHKK